MQAQALKAAGASEGAYKRVGAQLTGIRDTYLDTIKASSAYDVRQMQTISQTEAYTKALKDQKVHAMDAWRNRKLMNGVIKEQIDLQRAQAVSWRKDGQGRILSDLIIPRDAQKGWKNARVTLGAYNEVLRSVATETVKWGKNTQWAGRQLMVGFTVPLAIAAAATGKLAYDMDKALTQITKVYGDATQAIQDDSESIRSAAMQTANNMARLYGQSAKDTLEIEAQFAAAGKTGAELQQATAAATKARMLNEMDLQTAIQASITMQTVYGYTAEELGQKWEYINAVANQTVLGAEDFATAIPKVAGITKELGGTIEDLGVLMTAFKSAGIDAAEGANALKTISFRAVSAYGKGLDTFKKMTGKDLQSIIDQTNGETIPTLLKLYEAMESLNTPQKVAVVKDVFGIYQGNKALILMEQLAEQGGQVAQAMAVGKNSVAENAKIANQELERMNAQPYKKIEKAIESIKIQMAELGQVVLPLAADVLNLISGFLDFITNMPDAGKKFFLIAAGAVAIIGPITMLMGLFGNLFGNIMKLQGAFGGLITRFKFTDAAERAQVLIGKQATSVWNQQTGAVSRLTLELQKFNEVFATTTALQHKSQMAAVAPMGVATGAYSIKKDSLGRTQIRDINNGNRQISAKDYENAQKYAGALGKVEREEHARATALAETNKQMAEQQKHTQNVVRGAGAAAATAGMIATMFGSGSPLIAGLGNGLFLMGSLISIAPQVAVSIGKALITPFQMVGELAGPAVRQAKTQLSTLGTAIKGWAKAMAAPLAIAATAVLIYWQRVSAAADEANEKAKAYINTAKALGEVSGVNWQDATGVPDENMTGEQRFSQRAEAFRKNFEAESQALVDAGAETGDKWGIAISKGVEVRLHGGTVEAAKEATRTALAVMGEDFSDETFEVEVNAKINFDNTDNLIRTQLDTFKRETQRAADDLGTGMDRWNRDYIAGQDDLTEAAKTAATKAGQEIFNGMKSINDPRRRKDLWNTFNQENVSEMRSAYDKIIARAKENGNDVVAALSWEDFMSNKSGIAEGQLKYALGMTDEQVADFLRKKDAVIAGLRGIGSQTGDLSSSQLEEIFTPEQLAPYLQGLFAIKSEFGEIKEAGWGFDDYAKMHEEYGAAMDKAAQSDKNLSDAERLKLLNMVRANHGMIAATSLAQGFENAQIDAADAGMTLAESLKEIGSSLTEDQAIEAYKSVIESTTSDMVDFAMQSLDNEASASADALDRELDNLMDSFDDRSDAMEDKYDARSERLEKKQDKRRKGIEDYYDARIKKIDDAIEAEKAADAERERIYEAEKRRMERMSELYNQNVDLNSAITSGNFDEAAKIANDMAASTQQWSADDSNMRAGDASEARQKGLEAQKDALEQRKNARLEALRLTEEAEEKALARDKERAKESLDAAKAAAKAEYDDRKRTNALMWADRKNKLQQELDTIRAFIPRNKAELDKQAADIDLAYRKYGVKLQGYGTTWAKYVGDQFLHHQQVSANKIKSDIAWVSIGDSISKALLKGGFGMSAAQFTSWLNGGAAPKGSVFAPKQKERVAGQGSQGGTTKYHTGGIAGITSGGAAGIPSGHRDEVNATLLKGEGVLNRTATDLIGQENIMNLNNGKLPKNTGPWDMGIAGMGAAMAAGSMKRVMAETFKAVIARKASGSVGSAAGQYGNVKLSQEQLNNAATIMDTGRAMGASQRDLIIAVMTAMQESTLRNLNYGDRDSIGLFQQRPSQGWGSVEQIMNPRYSAKKFFEELFRVKDRNKMPLTVAAQKVQRSAFPDAYAKWESMARDIVGVGGVPGAFGSNINMAQYGPGGGAVLASGGWYKPAKGPVTSEYGMRVNPVTGVYKLHGGIDIGAAGGSPIYAAQRGQVSRAAWEDSRGNFTRIDHGGGIQTGYAHQSKMLVNPGQVVQAGQLIGRVGTTGNSTGNHLHFEYYKGGQRLNPRMIIPQFENGAYTLSGGLAELHPRETVLSQPLSEDLHKGLNQFAENGGSGYTNIDMRYSNFNSDIDVEKAVERGMVKAQRRIGVNRKIGDKK